MSNETREARPARVSALSREDRGSVAPDDVRWMAERLVGTSHRPNPTDEWSYPCAVPGEAFRRGIPTLPTTPCGRGPGFRHARVGAGPVDGPATD